MRLPNRLSKILLYLAVLSGSLWTGVYLLRLMLFYQIFEGPELVFRNFINEQNLYGIYNVLNPAVASTFFLYILFLVTFFLFLITSRVSLKKNGWLFIILIIIIVTAPFEIYLMTIDYKILMNINYGPLDTSLISELARKRIKIFSSFPLIELFSYFSFYYLILFKPLNVNED